MCFDQRQHTARIAFILGNVANDGVDIVHQRRNVGKNAMIDPLKDVLLRGIRHDKIGIVYVADPVRLARNGISMQLKLTKKVEKVYHFAFLLSYYTIIAMIYHIECQKTQ